MDEVDLSSPLQPLINNNKIAALNFPNFVNLMILLISFLERSSSTSSPSFRKFYKRNRDHWVSKSYLNLQGSLVDFGLKFG
ncbi:unnamed protein product [Lactuca virosa]|uniref:Uncharacterized protein n=1 Tax=Lactuca virosa TaxID=75947 RepID=A0AAU9MA13_9ASTR|nr:unnamed protein product [Lactuca virosa]CAH1417690.1 unnamed protein product [Lactuca virosa]